ncbi:MAG: DinB family protein [Chloroflexi bacterium]|nr:DinB family protein [Chloroflexota bacterium]
MINQQLTTAVTHLAQTAHTFTDIDLSQPYHWRKHDEGVRLAFLGTSQELRDLAVQCVQERQKRQMSITAAQHVLAQNHRGYRTLQAVLLGVTEAEYDQEPAANEWPLRVVLGHIVAAERWFHTLVFVGLQHKQSSKLPPLLPNDAPETIVGPDADFCQIMEEGSLAEMQAYYEKLHFRSWARFGGITADELAAPSPVWWEEETYSLQYRLHRFDAHLRQHLIQAEKTLVMLGRSPTEAHRLIRLLFDALAEVEGLTIGVERLLQTKQVELAAVIQERAETISAIVQQTQNIVAD